MAFKNYNKDVDYSIRLDQMMQAGASAQEVQDVLDQRVSKATDDPALYKYAYDSAYQKARAYIDSRAGAASDAGYAAYEKTLERTQENPYREKLNAALDNYMGREEFSYDPENDPAFKAYTAAYRREGDRASRNAMGAAATLTGGQASTAAVNAASQAQDYYNSKLGDTIPELYQLAYNRYRGEAADQLSALRTLAELADSTDTRNRSEREFAYKQYSDTRDDSRALYEATKARTEKERAAAEKEASSAVSAASGAEKDAYNRAMTFLNAGVMPTDQMLRAAGLDRAAAQSYRAAALRKQRK